MAAYTSFGTKYELGLIIFGTLKGNFFYQKPIRLINQLLKNIEFEYEHNQVRNSSDSFLSQKEKSNGLTLFEIRKKVKI